MGQTEEPAKASNRCSRHPRSFESLIIKSAIGTREQMKKPAEKRMDQQPMSAGVAKWRAAVSVRAAAAQ
jgi:hypothetical protein